MSQLVESIKILNGKVYNIDYHQKRFEKSQHELFGIKSSMILKNIINIPLPYQHGLVKCRVVYGQDIDTITYAHYQYRNIQKLKLVISSEPIDYQHKWVKRPQLDTLYSQRSEADEIIIVSEGRITDAFYYNLIFEKQNELFTPKHPILFGTQRAKLLSQGKIIETDIKVDQLSNYQFVHLVNALTPMGKVRVGIENLIL